MLLEALPATGGGTYQFKEKMQLKINIAAVITSALWCTHTGGTRVYEDGLELKAGLPNRNSKTVATPS